MKNKEGTLVFGFTHQKVINTLATLLLFTTSGGLVNYLLPPP